MAGIFLGGHSLSNDAKFPRIPDVPDAGPGGDYEGPDLSEPPSIALWRLNLVALSQTENVRPS